MEDPVAGEESAFVADDVSNIIKESVDAVLQNQQYSEAKVSQWTNICLENCVKKLAGLNKPFKYVVTCIIMQKNGEALACTQLPPAGGTAPLTAAALCVGRTRACTALPLSLAWPSDPFNAPAPPGGKWLDRDTNGCLNLQRIGESRQRPIELCRWDDLGALPPLGKEYQQGYKLVNDRLPKGRQWLHRAAEYRRGIDGRARNNA
ncbi:hypothetical protein QJQ45_022244 [Haematococcus lacustris]|nr:hypothetical protein QJQ45_022244 [Haematococcus lacustris]